MINTKLKVGITGIGGPIGFDLCQKLLSSRRETVEIQALYRNENKRIATAKNILAKSEALKWINCLGNEFNLEFLKKVTEESDIFIHFAAWGAHKIPEDQSAEVIKSNVLWTAVLSHLTLQAKTSRFIFASSRMVYTLAQIKPNEAIKEEVPFNLDKYKDWLAEITPQIETYASDYIRGYDKNHPLDFAKYLLAGNPIPNGTKDLYALSKYLGERSVLNLWDKGKEGIVLRFSPVFGPSPVESPERAIPKLIEMVAQNKEISVMPWKASFLYLGDLTPALIEAINTPISKEQSVINLGPVAKIYSQEEIADVLLNVSEKNLPIKTIEGAPLRQDELLDTARAQKILNLQESKIQESLKETYFYLSKRAPFLRRLRNNFTATKQAWQEKIVFWLARHGIK